MTSHLSRAAPFLALLAFACGRAPAPVQEAQEVEEVDGWRWVPCARTDARVEKASDEKGGAAVRMTFRKTGDERRLVALERKAEGGLGDARVLSVRYRLALQEGPRPRLALVVFEKGGGAWFRIGALPLAPDGPRETRLSLRSFRQAAFSATEDDALEWDKVEKLWLGLVFDAPAAGTIELSRAQFTAEPYRPTEPLAVPCDDASLWGVGKDPAAQGTLSIANEGPDGKPCAKFEFAFPGGRHMYALPTLQLPELELDGYRALRFACKARLPAGISTLLISLLEGDHSQYCAEPPASDEWRTLTIPFDQLTLGGWSKDENDRLDLTEIRSLIIGLHGTASEKQASGTIWATDIEFVP